MKTYVSGGCRVKEFDPDEFKEMIRASSQARFPMSKESFLKEASLFLEEDIIAILERDLPDTPITEELAFSAVIAASKEVRGIK